jgi:uncharacterized membrane protein
MSNSLVAGFAALLIVLTLFAFYIWATRRGADVSAAERRVFARFVLGICILWLVVIGAYFGAPLLGMVR